VAVKVHPANWQDKTGLAYVLRRVPLFKRWQVLILDAGYDSPALIDQCGKTYGVRVEIVQRHPDQTGFAVLPKRWIVERTFAWLGKCRRLSKDYEFLPQTSESWIYIAMLHLMLKRLSRH